MKIMKVLVVKNVSKKCEKKPCCGGCRMCYEEDEDLGKIFSIDDGKLIPIPKVDERSVDYIAGPSGSGKSTYASGLARAFKRIYPEKDFFIFFQEQIVRG